MRPHDLHGLVAWLLVSAISSGCGSQSVTPASSQQSPAVTVCGDAKRVQHPVQTEAYREELETPTADAVVVTHFKLRPGDPARDGDGCLVLNDTQLEVVVRHGKSQWRQTIASCASAGHGSVLGPWELPLVVGALCDDRDIVVERTSKGVLSVRDGAKVLGRIPIPVGTQRFVLRD